MTLGLSAKFFPRMRAAPADEARDLVGDLVALHRVFHVLHTELRATTGDQALPRQNERAWLKFWASPRDWMKAAAPTPE